LSTSHRVEAARLVYQSGRHWLKIKNPAAPAVKREAEEDWGVAQTVSAAQTLGQMAGCRFPQPRSIKEKGPQSEAWPSKRKKEPLHAFAGSDLDKARTILADSTKRRTALCNLNLKTRWNPPPMNAPL
jgi:hypothetical protein